jgi:hypothetical protein
MNLLPLFNAVYAYCRVTDEVKRTVRYVAHGETKSAIRDIQCIRHIHSGSPCQTFVVAEICLSGKNEEKSSSLELKYGDQCLKPLTGSVSRRYFFASWIWSHKENQGAASSEHVHTLWKRIYDFVHQ